MEQKMQPLDFGISLLSLIFKFIILMFKKGTYLISASFSRKILITMCGSCGFGKDLAFVRQKVWIEDPDITL